MDIYAQDEFLQQFLQESFDSQEFTKQLVETKNISKFLKDIDDNIERLNATLHEHVITHHEDLLSQAVGIGKLETVLESMLRRTTSLVETMARIRQRIRQPHTQLETRIAQLQRMHITCDALRKTVRAGHLIKRLQSPAMTQDTVKSSAIVSELEHLFQNCDWEGIHALVEYRRVTQQTKEKMEEKAWKSATTSLEASDHTGLANAFQVFHNLHQLAPKVEKLLEQRRERVRQQVQKTVSTPYLSQQRASQQQGKHNRVGSGGWLSGSSEEKSGTGGSGVGPPGRANLPSGSQTAQMRAALWTNVDRLLEELLACVAEVHFMAKLLRKKRDYATQMSLWCCLQEEPNAEALCAALNTDRRLDASRQQGLTLSSPISSRPSFPEECLQLLRSEVEKHCHDTADFIKQSFESEYPKLLKLMADFEKRLLSELDWAEEDEEGASALGRNGVQTSISRFLGKEDNTKGELEEPTPATISRLASIAHFLEPFEQAYLSRSLSRLFDPVELAFSNCAFSPNSANNGSADSSSSVQSLGLPSEKELESLVRVAANEVTFASVHPVLQAKVVRNIVKMLRLMHRRVENVAVVGPEASQITSSKQTDAQIWNVALVTLLHQLHMKVDTILLRGLRLDTEELPRQLLRDAVLEQDALMGSILQPLLQSITDSVEAILLTMHQENFAPTSNPQGGSKSCSLYMRELQEFIQRVRIHYLSGEVQAGAHLFSLLKPHVARCVDLFLTHASLLRPLSEAGSMRLAVDVAELELALNPLCVGQLSAALEPGPLYQRLREFRKILFESVEEIVQNPHLGTEVLPRSLVLHHLFSRAPPEFKSPHDAMHWSCSRYGQWLLEHPVEKERIALIQGALNAYATLIRNRGDRQYHPLYPVMVAIAERDS